MKRQFILCLFFSFVAALVYSQQIEFSHINNTNGLSNNQVESIFRDSRGFLWIGTNMGVNRYDGINFKTYKYVKGDPSSLMYDGVLDIQEDINGNLWMKVFFYTVYDWHKESFINNADSLLYMMGLPPAPSVIEIDKDKNFLLSYPGKGIYKYDVQTKNVTSYQQSDSNNELDFSEIIQVKAQKHFIWALHENGILERINTETGLVDFRNTFFKDNDKNSTISKSIFIDSDNQVWIYPGIGDKGTAYLSLKNNQWTFLNTSGTMPLSGSFVRCIGEDNNGRIWIGSDQGGINIVDKKTNTIEVLKNDVYNPYSISQNSVISILCESDGTVWAGTYKAGLSCYNPNMFKFKKTPLYYIFHRKAEVFDCNRLYKDKENNLWIGTNGQGLIKYNAQSGSVQRFQNNPNDPESISSDIITAIFEDHENTLWIGTFLGGLNAYRGRKFKRYQLDENNRNSLSNKSVYCIAEDNTHNLWIGTLGGGIDCLNPERNLFTNYNTQNSKLQSNFILSSFTDSLNNIYIGSDHGVYVIKQNSKEIIPYFSEPGYEDSLTVVSMSFQIVDSRGLLWMGTRRGINIYNPATKRFLYITSSNGLPGDEVSSLVEDNDGNIWAGTQNGLACIYCQYTNQTLEYSITAFGVNDGLPGSVCNQGAVFKDKDGTIYIGSAGGYVEFNPREIVYNRNIPQARFTDILITNQVIKPNVKYNGRVIIDKSIVDLNEIKLKYNETNFTIQFSALNFIHPEKNKYKYMLEGLDNNWIEITNGIGAASYSNLNPGTYKLIVYASNDDDIWMTDPITLKIIVEPPFWLSWWAYLIYLLIIAGIIRWFVKYKLNKQKKHYEQAQKILEADKQHEVDELKLRFFTNISHEFKTPLTLILTPLEKLMKSPVYPDYKLTMDIMYKNAHNLLTMVNEILDFRKFDLNKMTFHSSKGDIIEFTKDICLSFSNLAAEKSIKLTFTSYLQELQMEFDKEKMKKIVSNLISNAFKYTEEGHIDVSISISELMQNNEASPSKQMQLKVSDTGIGMKPEYLEKIFERFFRIEEPDKVHQSGTGVGLHLVSEYVKLHGGEISVESTEGKGSVFTVLIPMKNPVFTNLKNQDIIYLGDSMSLSLQDKENFGTTTVRRTDLPLLLVIDDNGDFCDFISDLFMDEYRIITANDGEEGHRIVLDELPDIILCDVMMPKMNGYELCRKVKEDMRTSHIPIILLTAKSSEESEYQGIDAGADDYISKPFNTEILKLKIAKIVEKQKKIQSNFKKKVDITLGDINVVSMDEKFIQNAVAIVEKNMSNPEFLVEDLCKEVGLSRVHFYKKVLALTGKTPSEFMRFIRLKHAKELLEKSQMYVSEIAYKVGFNEPKYLRKYFKEEFGITPNDYKKNLSK